MTAKLPVPGRRRVGPRGLPVRGLIPLRGVPGGGELESGRCVLVHSIFLRRARQSRLVLARCQIFPLVD